MDDAPWSDDLGLVCLFTSVVGCLACKSATLMSWRADDEIAGPAKAVMELYRSTHMSHNRYFEGVPGIGMHDPADTVPPGISLVTVVCAYRDLQDPDSITFGPIGHSVEYAQAPPKP